MNIQNRNKLIYNKLVEEVVAAHKDGVEYEVMLQMVTDTASFAYKNFPGLLSDYRLENIINEIGKKHLCLDYQYPKKNNHLEPSSLNILHIATTFNEVGGHTRIANQWMKVDCSNNHYLVLTNQIVIGYDATTMRGVKDAMVLNTEDSFISRAQKVLNYLSLNNIDLIILHHHPDDVVPVLACSVTNIPPVVLYNHADHVFGLGASIADQYIDYSALRVKYTVEKRMGRASEALPFPLEKKLNYSKASARKDLNIVDNELVLFSMGSAYKYKPFNEQNFLKFYSSLLKKYKHVKLYIAGFSEKDHQIIQGVEIPDNVVLLGVVPNPEKYLIAADYYIESFPLGGGLSSFDAAIFGTFPIFCFYAVSIYGGPGSIEMYSDKIKRSFPKNKNDYETMVETEINSGVLRKSLSQEIDTCLEECYPKKWLVRLHEIYKKVINNQHCVGMKNELVCLDDDYTRLYCDYSSQPIEKITTYLLSRDFLRSHFQLKIVLLLCFLYEKLKMRNLKGIRLLAKFLIR